MITPDQLALANAAADELGLAEEKKEPCETIHGFELPAGVTVADTDHWPAFAEYFEGKEGFTPNPTDSRARMLLEYYVEGAYQQWRELAAAKAELRKMLKEFTPEYVTEHLDLKRELHASQAREAQLRDAAMPFVRATRLQEPLNLPPSTPVRDYLPGAWPLYEDALKLVAALTSPPPPVVPREVADKLAAALEGCSNRLRVVLAEMLGETPPTFDPPAPSALENIRAVAAALQAYREEAR